MRSGIRGATKAPSGADSRKGLFNLVANDAPKAMAMVKARKEQREKTPINAFDGIAAIGLVF